MDGAFAGQLGPELVTNGCFDTDATGWTLGTGWTYDGVNSVVDTDGSTGALSTTVSLDAFASYLVRFITKGVNDGSGDFLLIIGGTSYPISKVAGNHAALIKAGDLDQVLAFSNTSSAYVGLIDCVSLKKIG